MARRTATPREKALIAEAIESLGSERFEQLVRFVYGRFDVDYPENEALWESRIIAAFASDLIQRHIGWAERRKN